MRKPLASTRCNVVTSGLLALVGALACATAIGLAAGTGAVAAPGLPPLPPLPPLVPVVPAPPPVTVPQLPPLPPVTAPLPVPVPAPSTSVPASTTAAPLTTEPPVTVPPVGPGASPGGVAAPSTTTPQAPAPGVSGTRSGSTPGPPHAPPVPNARGASPAAPGPTGGVTSSTATGEQAPQPSPAADPLAQRALPTRRGRGWLFDIALGLVLVAAAAPLVARHRRHAARRAVEDRGTDGQAAPMRPPPHGAPSQDTADSVARAALADLAHPPSEALSPGSGRVTPR